MSYRQKQQSIQELLTKANMQATTDPIVLVGKFYTTATPPSIEVTETSLRRRWNPSGDMTVYSFDKDFILFNFELKSDAKKVLANPWHVKGITLIIKEWPSHVPLCHIDFTVAYYWIKVEGLPLARYTEEESRRIGRRLSDKPLDGAYVSPTKRQFYVRVEIDLKKPLNPGFFIGKQRKRSFVQFKYLKIGRFCLSCGCVDHMSCKAIPKTRPLTRKLRTPMYGLWMVMNNFVERMVIVFPGTIDDPTEDEDTVPYDQFFFKLKVESVYSNKLNCGNNITLDRFLPDEVNEYRFRFPCSNLATILESNEQSQARNVLVSQMDENIPMVGLTVQEKGIIVDQFLIYLKKYVNSWSGRKWLPIRICVKKIKRISSVEYQTKLQDQKDEKLWKMIDEKMTEMIRRRVENNEDILSLPLWDICIQYLMTEMGVKRIPLGFTKTAEKARAEAIEYGIRFFNGQIEADKESIRDLERLKVKGDEMDVLEPCSICQEGMFLGDEVIKMPCSHVFHSVCIEEWLQKGNQCPLCRFELPIQRRIVCPAEYNRYQHLKRRFL